jgi:hypothetical protein
MSRKLVTVVIAVLAALAPSGIAHADASSSGDDFVWPPAHSTHGKWLAIPQEYYEGGGDIDACGTTVAYGYGDVRRLQYNAAFLKDGTEVVLYRGDATSDLVRASDGATLDEVPNDGPGVETYSPDGLTITFTYTGPAVFPAFDAVERAAFRRAGLPTLALYRGGVVSLKIRLSPDPNASTDASATILLNRAQGLVDGCTLLDRAAHRR